MWPCGANTMDLGVERVALSHGSLATTGKIQSIVSPECGAFGSSEHGEI